MGAFDDLVPQSQGGGTFDDLVPKAKPVVEDSSWRGQMRQAISESPVGGIVKGLADLPMGAAQLLGNLIGVGDVVNQEAAQREAEYQAARKARGSEGFDFGRMAGGAIGMLPAAAATPVLTGARGFGNVIAQTGKNALIQGAAGAGMGAVAAPVTQGDFWDEKLGQIGGGAVVGAAVPVGLAAVSGGAKAAGGLLDAVRGRLGDIRAGKIARAAAGGDEQAIRQILENAPNDITAAQAVAGIPNAEFQALGALTKEKGGTPYMAIDTAQQDARMAALQAATPDEAAAIAARDAMANATYGKAFASDAQRIDEMQRALQAAEQTRKGGMGGYTTPAPEVIPEIAAMSGNPVIESAAKEASKLAASQGINIGNPLASLQGLHYIKLAIDNQFKNRTASTALQNYTDAALNNTKQQLLQAIEGTSNAPGISPLYGLAREQFAQGSVPVNQAQLMNQLMLELKKPGGGERVMPFLRNLTTGENALIKRSGGQPRFGGISDVLNQQQMGAVTKAATETERDLAMKEMAKAGRGNLDTIISDASQVKGLPPLFMPIITAANALLRQGSKRVEADALKRLVVGMQNGGNALALLNELPATERNQILKALVTQSGKAAPDITAALVGGQE